MAKPCFKKKRHIRSEKTYGLKYIKIIETVLQRPCMKCRVVRRICDDLSTKFRNTELVNKGLMYYVKR